jgi:hypothetical protein
MLGFIFTHLLTLPTHSQTENTYSQFSSSYFLKKITSWYALSPSFTYNKRGPFKILLSLGKSQKSPAAWNLYTIFP